MQLLPTGLFLLLVGGGAFHAPQQQSQLLTTSCCFVQGLLLPTSSRLHRHQYLPINSNHQQQQLDGERFAGRRRMMMLPTRQGQVPSTQHTKRDVQFYRPRSAFSVAAAATAPATTTSIGFLGHSGLIFISIVLVRRVYGAIRSHQISSTSSKDIPPPPPAGILDRCPWPFVVFHDVRQFFRDSPTWVTLLYVVLWRAIKMAQKSRTILGV
jgi:hypothetical protein